MTTDHKPQAGTLAEFLLARIAEDEAIAKAAKSAKESMDDPGDHWNASDDGDNVYTSRIGSYVATGRYGGGLGDAVAHHIARWDPARVLAECEAKRLIVEIHGNGDAWCDYCAGYVEGMQDECHTGRLLALPYADHPDYRQEWRP